MMKKEFAFASSAVRVMENALLPDAFLDAVTAADSRAELARLLTDRGLDAFARPLSQNEAEEALEARLAARLEEAASLFEDRSVMDFLFVKNDFHNLKAILLCQVLKKDPEPFFLAPSLADPREIRRLAAEKNWEAMPAFLRGAAREGYETLTAGMDSAQLRMFLDARASEAALAASRRSGSPVAETLTRRELDEDNHKVARTLAAFEEPRETLLAAAFAAGGRVSPEEWKKAVLAKDLTGPEARLGIDPALSSTEREREFSRAIRAEWDRAKNGILTPDAVFAYCLACRREAEEIRVAWAATVGTEEREHG